MKANPKYLSSGNALDFVSENKGENYNNCHFVFHFRGMTDDSGQILKSHLSTYGEMKVTWPTSIISIKREVSSMRYAPPFYPISCSAGAMHPSIQSQPPCSFPKRRFIFLMILDTSMYVTTNSR